MLTKALAWGTAATLFVVPFLYGANHPPARIVYILVVVTLFVAHVRSCWQDGRRPWPTGPAGLLLLVGVGLAGASLIPVPTPLLRLLSPEAWRWSIQSLGEAGVPTPWFRAWAVAPVDGSLAFATGAAHLLLFAIAAAVARRAQDAHRLVVAVVLGGVLVGILAILQDLSDAGRIYWIGLEREQFYGAFVNGNHTATFLGAAAVAALAIGLGRSSERGPIPHQVFLGAAAFCAVAVLYSLSRGGIIALTVGLLAVLAAVLLVRPEQRDAPVSKLAYAPALALLAVPLLYFVWLGPSTVAREVATLGTMDVPEDYRSLLWRDCVGVVKHFWLVGAGPGGFPSVFPGFRTFVANVRAQSAESELVQVFVELGLSGALCLIGAWALILRRAVVAAQERIVVALAGGGAFLVITVHSAVDFPLHTVAVAAAAAGMAGVVIGRTSAPGAARRPLAWLVLPGAVVVALVAWLLAGDARAPVRSDDRPPTRAEASEARERLLRQVRANPGRFLALVDLAHTVSLFPVEQRDGLDPRVLYALGEARDPTQPYAIQTHARYLARVGATADAEVVYDRLFGVLAQHSPGREHTERWDAAWRLGDGALWSGDPDRAEGWFARALDLDPRHPAVAMHGLGNVAYVRADTALALRHYLDAATAYRTAPYRLDEPMRRRFHRTLYRYAASARTQGDDRAADAWLATAARADRDLAATQRRQRSALGDEAVPLAAFGAHQNWLEKRRGQPGLEIVHTHEPTSAGEVLEVAYRSIRADYEIWAVHLDVEVDPSFGYRLVLQAPAEPGQQLVAVVDGREIYGGRVREIDPGRYELTWPDLGKRASAAAGSDRRPRLTSFGFNTRGRAGRYTFERLDAVSLEEEP